MKTGIIDVGGGMRGAYAAGVLEYCMENDIHFDTCIGVSAGSANLMTYLAGQKCRSIKFYHDYVFHKEYMSLRNFLRTGSYLDLYYIYGTLCNSNADEPLDYDTFAQNPAEFFVVAQEVHTGKVKYFDKSDIGRDDYRPLMASSNLPGVNRPFEIDGVLYFDGALADPVPLKKAFELGCDRVVLILTKPASIPRTVGKDAKIAKIIKRKYPLSAQNLLKRAERYNDSVSAAKEYAAQGKVLIVSPDDTCGVDTLTKDKDSILALYNKGLHDGEEIKKWLAI